MPNEKKPVCTQWLELNKLNKHSKQSKINLITSNPSTSVTKVEDIAYFVRCFKTIQGVKTE